MEERCSKLDIVVHEIGNMIMGIDFSAKKLTENEPELENNKYFVEMKEDIKNIMKMIIETKSEKKTYVEKQRIYERVDIKKELERLIEKYDERCYENNIHLIYETYIESKKYIEGRTDTEFCVIGNKCELIRLFDNIIKNAYEELKDYKNDFVIEKYIGITLVRNDEWLVIEINDNGGVIDSKRIEHIFEVQLSSKEDGMGIGLNICKKIVDNHKGKIKAASDESSGTTFTIYLPIID